MSMDQVRELISSNFVVVEADWTMGRVSALLRNLDPEAVIVHRVDDDQDLFYLRPAGDLLASQPSLDSGSQVSVMDYLGLHEWQASPVVDAMGSISGRTNDSVVVADDRILGYVSNDMTLADWASAPATWGGTENRPASRGGTSAFESTVCFDPFESTGSLSDSHEVVRHLEVDHPQEATVGEPIDVIVVMSGDDFVGLDPATQFSAELGAELDLIISTRAGLQLEGQSSHRLMVEESGETQFCLFRLRAIEQGIGSALLLAFINGAQVAAVPIGIRIVERGEDVPASRVRQDAQLRPSDRRQPDLMLLIYEQVVDGQQKLEFQLHARDAGLGLNMARFGPVDIRIDPARHFSAYFSDIEELLDRDAPPAEKIDQRMKTLGASLYEAVVPSELRDRIWAVRDRIQQVLIQSTDPWIPWEMCFITGPDGDGHIIEHGYLCEHYDVSRWIQPIPLQPDLSLERMGLVVTGDSGLQMARRERDQIMALGIDGRTVEDIPADYLALITALAGGTFTGLHFVGHGLFADGEDPNKTLIALNRNEPFTARDIVGRAANLGKARPFVFLNACQAGRGAMTLTGPGGWAKALLSAGAGAFLGAHWSVLDEPAVRFSEVLYENLINKGETLPAALRKARLAIRVSGDPTWLAYTLYSDTFARVAGPPKNQLKAS